MKFNHFLLVFILVLAAFLRLWNLGDVPPTVSLDEASIGYNAYSVSKIGVDEYGQFPLISQRGYDDWRRSTYLFLTVPFISLFGLNAISIRLPAAILSILTIWTTYHIVMLLFPKRSSFSLNAALFSSLLLAISPWHIYISRLGHESNACLSFFVFAVFFFLKSMKKKNWILLLVSGIFFTLSMISYYSGQAFIPLFVVGLFFIFRKNILSVISNKKILIVFSIFLILIVPVFWTIFSPKSLIRFQGTSTFKPEAHWELFSKRVELWNKSVENNNIIGTIFYNRHLFPLQVFTEGYFSHFKPEWLFTNSLAESFKVPRMGLLYLWEIPLIAAGIIILIISPLVEGKTKKIIFLWFFLAPLPAAIATQAPHAMRSYNFLPTWQILSALGLSYLIYRLQKFKLLIFTLFFVFVILSFLTFYQNYFFLFPKEQSASFQYALSKTIPFVSANEKNYNKVVFSNKENLYQSYMFFLFYNKHDPSIYQKQGGTKSGGFAETHKIGKYEFKPIDFLKEGKDGKTLLIGNSNDFPPSAEVLKTFSNLDGKEVIKIIKQ